MHLLVGFKLQLFLFTTISCNQDVEEIGQTNQNNLGVQFEQGTQEFRLGLNTTFLSLTNNPQVSNTLVKEELLSFAKTNNFFNRGITQFEKGISLE